ncbi:MAG: type II toxin-antitoxin system Phd/YefM family antitoxin [Candidatus Xenobiia bacterium LiM19]
MHIAAGKFKIHCLRLMDEVQKNHNEIIITKRGKPVARLVPVDDIAPVPLFGYLKDSVTIAGDIVKPIEASWNAEQKQ